MASHEQRLFGGMMYMLAIVLGILILVAIGIILKEKAILFLIFGGPIVVFVTLSYLVGYVMTDMKDDVAAFRGENQ